MSHLKTNEELILMIRVRPVIWNDENEQHTSQKLKDQSFAEVHMNLIEKKVLFSSGKAQSFVS